MAKRKHPDPDIDSTVTFTDTPSKRRRKTTDGGGALTNGDHEDGSAPSPSKNRTPKQELTPSKRKRKSVVEDLQAEEDEDEDSPTPKPNGRTLFSTPTRGKGTATATTPSKSARAKADRSAKRKSARLLAEAQDDEDDDLDGQDARLAREILDEEDEEEEDEGPDGDGLDQDIVAAVEGNEVDTPSKKSTGKRGRPKGAKSRRSPTPEGDIPPEERYFYQNRSGPPQVSSNKFNSVKLLTDEEYLENISSWQDPHEPEKAFLMKLHTRSFPQWRFELAEGFGLCLYGYGSKQPLVNHFAEYMYSKCHPPPRIVVVNGYIAKLNPRTILNTIASAVSNTEDEAIRLTGQPEEMLDTLFSHITDEPPSSQLLVMVNSIDSTSLRRPSMQSLLARLAAHPHVCFLATCDTPTFPALWNSSLLDQFKFVFHDCTTFAPYTAEIGSVVDEVHELLGRKRMRAGGKEGIGFVLKSLPENARNLYRLLLAEILSIVEDGLDGEGTQYANDNAAMAEEDDGQRRTASRKASRGSNDHKTTTAVPAPNTDAEEVGIEYRTLYRKAAEEFICSSSMNFQFLLKEFLDHQMITSRRDPVSGAELLGVPLGKAEMESVLEELI
ncbi:putative origin recognition complex subunit 2 [Fonsecaea pedrosoi]|nr:putative origin recognition complex subunit 2 [Fonsecaea pedrosoi]